MLEGTTFVQTPSTNRNAAPTGVALGVNVTPDMVGVRVWLAVRVTCGVLVLDIVTVLVVVPVGVAEGEAPTDRLAVGLVLRLGVTEALGLAEGGGTRATRYSNSSSDRATCSQ
jgi:hypothetical protein